MTAEFAATLSGLGKQTLQAESIYLSLSLSLCGMISLIFRNNSKSSLHSDHIFPGEHVRCSLPWYEMVSLCEICTVHLVILNVESMDAEIDNLETLGARGPIVCLILNHFPKRVVLK